MARIYANWRIKFVQSSEIRGRVLGSLACWQLGLFMLKPLPGGEIGNWNDRAVYGGVGVRLGTIVFVGEGVMLGVNVIVGVGEIVAVGLNTPLAV